MAKNILIVTGSPRRGGNSDRMADAFLRGAQRAGHTVTKFEAAFCKLSGCLACDRCWTEGRACIVNDDWQDFSDRLEQADVIVFAYPLYWGTMPSQLKRLVDRLYSYCSPKTLRSIHGKHTVLLACGECEGQEIFRDALSAQEGLNGYFEWTMAGTVLADSVFESGAIEKTDALARAEELGASL